MNKIDQYKLEGFEVPSLFKLALEAADDGVVITDINGFIQWVNPAYENMTGYSLDEVRGKHTRILKSGKQDSAFYKKLWGTISAGNVWKGELWNKRKDDTTYLEQQSITPFQDGIGKIAHYIAIKRDITNQHNLINQLNMARRMDAIVQLTAGVAHNFNNKLATILGNVELVHEEAEQYSNEYLDDCLQEISIAAKDARDLVVSMMAFSHDDVNEIKPVDLLPAMNEITKSISNSLPLDVKLTTQFSVVPEVNVDPVRLYQ